MLRLLFLLLLTSSLNAQPWSPYLMVTAHNFSIGQTGRIETLMVAPNPTRFAHAFHASFTFASPAWVVSGFSTPKVYHNLNPLDPLFLTCEQAGWVYPLVGWGTACKKISSTESDSPYPAHRPRCCLMAIPNDPSLIGIKIHVQGTIWEVDDPDPRAVTAPITVQIK